MSTREHPPYYHKSYCQYNTFPSEMSGGLNFYTRQCRPTGIFRFNIMTHFLFSQFLYFVRPESYFVHLVTADLLKRRETFVETCKGKRKCIEITKAWCCAERDRVLAKELPAGHAQR